MVGNVLAILIGGLIIGGLGKMVAPGDRDNIPLWLTFVCGIVGMLVGGLVYYWIFGVADNVSGNSDYGWDNTTKGIDWWRHVWQIAAAAGAVIVAAEVTGRSKTKV
jgi:uncharacterized membrane protein YeaQ/YmgE (transglycosylase-associated protein family)